MGVTLGGNVTVALNIPSLMKSCSKISVFSVWGAYIFVPLITVKPRDNIFQIHWYVHQILHMKNIWVSWYVDPVISLMLCCFYNPWMVLIVPGHIMF